MAFIDTVPEDQAHGDVARMFEQNRAAKGYVPNYVKAFSHRPQVMEAWANLLGSVRSTLDSRRYELVTLAAAKALKSSYCMLAHGSVLLDYYDDAQLTQIAEDYTQAGLNPEDVVMMAFAEKIARDASSVTAQDTEGLRTHGFSDEEIFDVAAAASARCFFSKLLDALGAEPDAHYLELEPNLRQALTVGRPISETP